MVGMASGTAVSTHTLQVQKNYKCNVVSVFLYTYIYVHTYICTSICMYMCAYTHIYIVTSITEESENPVCVPVYWVYELRNITRDNSTYFAICGE